MTATFCNNCGRPVDADKDGVPDALGNMIEQKARAIVDEKERQREEAAARDKAAVALKKLEEERAKLEEQLKGNERLPRSWFGAFFHISMVTAIIFVFFWLTLGALVHLFLFGALEVSPAGPLLCPGHCDTCDGPGRVISYNYKGPWHSNNGKMGYAFICHNKEYNVEGLSPSDVRSEPLNTKLQPYIISGFLTYVVEGAIMAPTLGILVALFTAQKRRKGYDVERADILNKIRVNDATRQALGAPVPETATFRG
jgi:hypothetical protein